MTMSDKAREIADRPAWVAGQGGETLRWGDISLGWFGHLVGGRAIAWIGGLSRECDSPDEARAVVEAALAPALSVCEP